MSSISISMPFDSYNNNIYLHSSLPPHSHSKVYLVIDGGRFYSHEAIGLRLQRVYVQTTILGEYYFSEYLQKYPQYSSKPLQPIVHSPYCKQQTKRPYFSTSDVQEAIELDHKNFGGLTAKIPSEGHRIHIPSSSAMSSLETVTDKNKPVVVG